MRLQLRSTFDDKPICNLIGPAFNSSPLDRLVVVATPDRYFLAAKNDDDIKFRNAVVASYTYFGGVFGDHVSRPIVCSLRRISPRPEDNAP
jgi:hypothetical protein